MHTTTHNVNAKPEAANMAGKANVRAVGKGWAGGAVEVEATL